MGAMGKETLGEFEQLVLLACLQLKDRAYTVPIIEELERRAGRSVSHASVYVTLQRLEKKGLVHSELSDPRPERGGKPRRYFSVQPAAMPQLRSARDALLNMWQGLEPIRQR
jgi:PadR family transcriptional regulator, regulatory protein PadR